MTLNRLRDVADWARSFPRLNELTPDFSYASILKSSSIGNLGSRSRLQVILGTHSILADGGLQSIAGSHMIAVSASHHSGQSIEWIVFAEVEIMFIHSVLSSHAVINGNRLMNPSNLLWKAKAIHEWMTNRELTISSFHCLSSVPLIVVSAMYKLSPQFFRSADHDTFNQFFSPEKVFPQANSWVAEWVRITISLTVGQHKILQLNLNQKKLKN